jgi:hypothetical protein
MQRSLLPIYTRNSGLIEAEFLKREFGLILTEINTSNLATIKNSTTCIFATTNPIELEPVIKDSNPDSLIIFILGNETYSVPIFEYLNRYKDKIKLALIYNLPKRTSYWVSLRCLLAAIYDGGLFFKIDGVHLIRNFKNGVDFMRRNRELKFDYKHFDFPLGYTNMFVKELNALGLAKDNKSLFNDDFFYPFLNSKFKTMSFIGANGSWARRLAVKKMKKLVKDNQVQVVQDSYKGLNSPFESSTSYIKSLIDSKFVLCPPGNLTNKTFRYLESLLMGALPILPPATIQDNHLWDTWVESSGKIRYSWTKCINQALRMSESDRKEKVTKALASELEKIRAVNTKIDQALV